MTETTAPAFPVLEGVAYEIWDVEGQGVVCATATVDEAVALVRDWLQKLGPSYVESLLVIRWDEDRRASLVAEGLQIVARAPISAPKNQESPETS
jgi:hypothetical protein